MEELMMDMMMEDEKATLLLDKITDFACSKAETYTGAGADILSLGDDIGTQELLPYGTPRQVKDTTLSRLEKCGKQGGIVVGPTHVVEPEVPWDNLMAIVEGVKEFELEA